MKTILPWRPRLYKKVINQGIGLAPLGTVRFDVHMRKLKFSRMVKYLNKPISLVLRDAKLSTYPNLTIIHAVVKYFIILSFTSLRLISSTTSAFGS